MDVTLMADVVEDSVLHGIIYVKQRNAQLHDTQIGSEMAAVFRAHGNDAPAQLAGKALQLRVGEPMHVAGALDGFKKGCTVHDSAILPASP